MDADTIAQIVGSIKDPEILKIDEEHQFLALPPGYTGRTLLPSELPPPNRIVQRVTLQNPTDFVVYVKRFEDPAITMVFADEPTGRYEAILDYHDGETGDRAYCDHRAFYTCPLSDEWKLWTSTSGKPQEQGAFAKFLEENLPDIHEPPAADLLAVALSLEVHKNAKFDSDIRLDNGQRQFTYAEEIRGQTRQGNLAIPEAFTISIPVFIDGKLYKILARLRYRMNDGKLTIWHELVRANDFYRQAVTDVTKLIDKELQDVQVVRGTPK
jgi:uncharacterized protein YfdQ (DUF2303 family)